MLPDGGIRCQKKNIWRYQAFVLANFPLYFFSIFMFWALITRKLAVKVSIWRYCTLGMAVRPEIQLATLVVACHTVLQNADTEICLSCKKVSQPAVADRFFMTCNFISGMLVSLPSLPPLSSFLSLFLFPLFFYFTMCPRSSDPFYIVTYFPSFLAFFIPSILP